jgi:hypothetical protein
MENSVAVIAGRRTHNVILIRTAINTISRTKASGFEVLMAVEKTTEPSQAV